MPRETTEHPGVSYVMPVLNEVEHIEAAVLSLIDQDYEGPFEVVLALGPSVDGTNQVIAELAQADPRIRSIPNELGSALQVVSTPPSGLPATRSSCVSTRTRCCHRDYTRVRSRRCCARARTTWAAS
jgi:glycosyltransferase involved in cell wall biosynthesis